MQWKAKQPLGRPILFVHNMQHKNKPDCNLTIPAGLKSSDITDEPERVLCPFQEDCLVKLDYIS